MPSTPESFFTADGISLSPGRLVAHEERGSSQIPSKRGFPRQLKKTSAGLVEITHSRTSGPNPGLSQSPPGSGAVASLAAVLGSDPPEVDSTGGNPSVSLARLERGAFSKTGGLCDSFAWVTRLRRSEAGLARVEHILAQSPGVGEFQHQWEKSRVCPGYGGKPSITYLAFGARMIFMREHFCPRLVCRRLSHAAPAMQSTAGP